MRLKPHGLGGACKYTVRMSRTASPPPALDAPSSAAARGTAVAVFANPYSGRGPNRRYVDRLAAALCGAGFEPRVVWRPDERRALLADPDLPDRCRCIVAAGGDGSIADVINEMASHGLLDAVPFATFPIGTENLVAREFGFARHRRRPDDLARAIAAGKTRRVDLGQAGDRLFTLMVSAGFDAQVVHRMADWRCAPANGNGGAIRRANRLSYAPRILACIRDYPYPPVTVEVDGERHTGSHLFIFNIPQYGGNLGIARHACCDDAHLDWVLFQRPGLLSLAGYGWTVLRGAHLRRSDVAHGRATSLRITCEAPAAIQADGDPAGFTPLDVAIRPGALRVIDVR